MIVATTFFSSTPKGSKRTTIFVVAFFINSLFPLLSLLDILLVLWDRHEGQTLSADQWAGGSENKIALGILQDDPKKIPAIFA